MGLFTNILFIVMLIFVIYIVFGYFSRDKTQLSNYKLGNEPSTIKASKVVANSNYTYSLWFYVNNWQYRLGDEKILLSKNNELSNSNPEITLAPYENNININITTYKSTDTESSSEEADNHDCTVRNFPLQKWVNLIIVLHGRTLDVYLDGKLIRTCVLPGVPRSILDSDINITPDGGFSGWTSNIQYWPKAYNPQQAYNVYKEGSGLRGLWALFEKYKIKIAYLVNNVERGSVSI